MNTLLCFSSYIVMRIYKPKLPENHPWKNIHITPKQWADNSTQLNKDFSLVFWSFFFALIVIWVNFGK